ncbi:MAG: GGDEF and EAL domain-containing protein [Tissierellales bacterium]|nr:GGDEF and EAL domain-containing protein [Tissierellales bacterium]
MNEADRMSETQVLKENLRNYGKLLEEIGGEVWELKLSPIKEKVDKDFAKYSFNYEENMMLNFGESIHEEDLENINEKLERFIDCNDDKLEIVYRVKDDNNHSKWVYSRGIKVYDKKGNLEKIIGIRSDITEKVVMKEALFKLSHFDPLTNLPNKEKLKEDFSRLRNQKNIDNLAFLFIDIDDFKHVNNVLGYGYGDEFLKKFAEFLKHEFSPDNLIGRLSADEFLVIFTNYKDIISLEGRIDKLLRDLRKKNFLLNTDFKLSASIGYSIYKINGSDFDTLLRYANTALHYSKSKGKSQFVRYSDKLGEYAFSQADMLNQIRIAIERNEFIVYFQPIVHTINEEIFGYEALVRWVHPHRGMISPGQFIPIAEASGQMVDIEKIVIEECFRRLKLLRKLNPDMKYVSINLSARGIIERNIIKFLERLILKYDVDPKFIEFEVTESSLLNNIEWTIETLDKIKEMGFKLSLDDFGTGYSSLNYLKNLPFDKVKLDKSFIDNIAYDERDHLMVKSIIELSHRLGLLVVGEGVETKSQRDLLYILECDFIQGYYYGKPQPIDI